MAFYGSGSNYLYHLAGHSLVFLGNILWGSWRKRKPGMTTTSLMQPRYLCLWGTSVRFQHETSKHVVQRHHNLHLSIYIYIYYYYYYIIYIYILYNNIIYLHMYIVVSFCSILFGGKVPWLGCLSHWLGWTPPDPPQNLPVVTPWTSLNRRRFFE